MRWTRRLLYVTSLATLLVFPYGPLFPWSPMRPGYDTLQLARADVVYPSGVLVDPAYLDLDKFIMEAEKFHALAMPKRVTVVACRDWADFHRFVPQIRGQAVAAVTIQTGTAIFVTPKIAEKHLDVAEFLRHELSHAALHQNQGLIDAYRIEQQQWFCEGLAVLFGHQRSYISAAEFRERTQETELFPLFTGPQSDMRFGYQAWRYFLDYWIQTRGRESFLKLEKRCISAPLDCAADRKEIEDFQTAVRTGTYIPRD